MSGGIHIRGVEKYDPQRPHDKMLEFTVWPLPADVLPHLHIVLHAAAEDYLKKVGLTNGNKTELTAKGGVH